MHDEEIRLIGQPVRITVNGKKGSKVKAPFYGGYPTITAGETYNGYALKDIYDYNSSVHDIYIEVDGSMYQFGNYPVDNGYPLTKYISLAQDDIPSQARKLIWYFKAKLDELTSDIESLRDDLHPKD